MLFQSGNFVVQHITLDILVRWKVGAAAKHIALYSDSLPRPIRSKALPYISFSNFYITARSFTYNLSAHARLGENTARGNTLQDKQYCIQPHCIQPNSCQNAPKQQTLSFITIGSEQLYFTLQDKQHSTAVACSVRQHSKTLIPKRSKKLQTLRLLHHH